MSKADFVTSRFLGESVRTKVAVLLVRCPDGTTFHHHCGILKKVQRQGRPGEDVELKGGEVIECLEGAVRLMDFGGCAMWDLYARPTQDQVRKLIATEQGFALYRSVQDRASRRRGEPVVRRFVSVPGPSGYQIKFGGGPSNR